ncbi:MAG: 16S rRNA (guanine(527)-N(7))-methyltransferase RsmG [Acidobacteria bacterium]|nr:16S rRNA (guanine(527)-N(7))-methyltransferase RsmG [Acidobacteriota bacterium]
MSGDTKPLAELLEQCAKQTGIPLSSVQQRQLLIHFELLLSWNQKMNLSAIRDPRQIAERHFAESLFLASLLPAPDGLPGAPARIMIDVGSGAGFPGLPLKVVWPHVETVLLEPNQKKATFLKDVIRQCGLERASVSTDRLETAARGEMAGRAALVTMRAVAVAHTDLDSLARLLDGNGQVALFLGEADAERVARDSSFCWLRMDVIPNSLRRMILTGTPSR